jgi:LPXTG-motif cell wall-anchored protein
VDWLPGASEISQGEADLSTTKVYGPVAAAAATAATLPVTGSNAVTAALVGFALVAAGLLLVRSARARRTDA